jgi:hypothetical protein
MNEVEETTKYTTVDKDTWAKMIEASRKDFEYLPGAYYDMHGVDYLAPVIDAYMTAPVAIYNGKPIEARSVIIKDIGEALETMMNNGERIVMYMLMYIPGQPVYSKIDDATFTEVKLDKPHVNSGSWKMRFGKIA